MGEWSGTVAVVTGGSAATGRAETMVVDNAARRSAIAGLERGVQLRLLFGPGD